MTLPLLTLLFTSTTVCVVPPSLAVRVVPSSLAVCVVPPSLAVAVPLCGEETTALAALGREAEGKLEEEEQVSK